MPVIEFHTKPEWKDILPAPKKASKFIPEWFKKLENQSNDNPSSGTVKRCVPFIDALSFGYIIPMWSDCWVNAQNGELNINFPSNYPFGSSIENHTYEQIRDYPLKNSTFGKNPLKWMNPWTIKTSPGYSSLFTSPLNHMETRFKILDGVVDTDTYYNQVNFPFLWLEEQGSFFIEQGTPLIQVIPFKRENWKDPQIKSVDKYKKDQVNIMLGTYLKNGYKNLFSSKWSSKK